MKKLETKVCKKRENRTNFALKNSCKQPLKGYQMSIQISKRIILDSDGIDQISVNYERTCLSISSMMSTLSFGMHPRYLTEF